MARARDDAERRAVYIGVQNAVRYERNPNMQQNC